MAVQVNPSMTAYACVEPCVSAGRHLQSCNVMVKHHRYTQHTRYHLMMNDRQDVKAMSNCSEQMDSMLVCLSCVIHFIGQVSAGGWKPWIRSVLQGPELYLHFSS